MTTEELIPLAQSGDRAAMDTIVRENTGLIKSVAVRFLGRGCEFDDLCQIGSIGMIKAVRGFDASFGTRFSTYAVPLIMGEIKRFLRDDGMIKISRDVKSRGVMLLRLKEKMQSELMRDITVKELADAAGIEAEEAAMALEATGGVMSLSDPVGETSLENLLGTDHIDALVESIALRQAVASLAPEDRRLIKLRFYDGMSQSEAGQHLGMSQVRVSRREKKILAILKEQMT